MQSGSKYIGMIFEAYNSNVGDCKTYHGFLGS
jgi:hypothetical protein